METEGYCMFQNRNGTHGRLLAMGDYSFLLEHILLGRFNFGDYIISGLDLTPEEIHADVLALQQDLSDRFS